MADSSSLMALRDATRHYRVRRRSGTTVVKALDGVNLQVAPGETLSIVGESGCGKTTTAKLLLGLEPPSSGQVIFEEQDLASLNRAGRRRYRASVQAVFQDPWSSLDPRMRVGDFVTEPARIGRTVPRAQLPDLARDLLVAVGLDARHARSFPHQFSGGQRQRIAVARALSSKPRLIVLDEPVSALDVSIRAQIMNLLRDLQAERGFALVLISHDLGTVRYLSHRLLVMYLGRAVESGDVADVFASPAHPYTRALLSAELPPRVEAAKDQIVLSGDPPSPLAPPSGCRFHTRCWIRRDVEVSDECSTSIPELRNVGANGLAACHHAEKLLAGTGATGSSAVGGEGR